MSKSERREFLRGLATATGSVVLLPIVTACKGDNGGDAKKPEGDKKPEGGKKPAGEAKTPEGEAKKPAGEAKKPEAEAKKPEDNARPRPLTEVPQTKPDGWNPIEYNKDRGNAGKIPKSYLGSINGPDGPKKHLGKHLPFVPKVDAGLVPEGFVALMWGDPGKGHARHPNAVKNESNNNEGHWYNWIKIRKAVAGQAEELQSAYADWPVSKNGEQSVYAVLGGGDITADGGRNTIYLAALPKDVKKGDTVRIWAHCLTHGEYVDFITV